MRVQLQLVAHEPPKLGSGDAAVNGERLLHVNPLDFNRIANDPKTVAVEIIQGAKVVEPPANALRRLRQVDAPFDWIGPKRTTFERLPIYSININFAADVDFPVQIQDTQR